MARQNLWQLLFATGRVAEAADHLADYTRSYPEDAEAWHLLGLARIRLGKTAEAMTALRQAIALNPGHVLAHNSLGIALEETGDVDAASSAYEHSIRIGPNRPEAYNNLALNRLEQGRAPEAIELFRRSLGLDRRQMHIYSNYLLALNYLSNLPPQTLLTEHTNWAANYAQPERPPARVHRPSATGPLHVGYVSPDFRSHPVAAFIGAVLGAHDRKLVRVTCYSSAVQPDETTGQLRALADQWRDILNMSDAQAAELIRKDKVDVLVDLSGHSSRHRLGIFARRAAPVQVTCFGYPNTTGMPAMDYRLTDANANPDGTDSWHVEKLVRLPEVAWCWKPPEIAPPVGPLPADETSGITFGSLNNPAKLTAEAIALWASIIADVPGSKLLVLASKSRSAQQRMATEFAKLGAEGRVEVLPRMTPAEYYAAYNRIDIGLDPFPYNGGVTTCDALWMGVPVVSLIGSNYAGRQGLSILTAIGLPELAAANVEEYVAIAQKLAGDRDRLRETRAGLRERMRASPVCNAARYVRGLEAAYREMVKRA
jgi:predicted O-linked N-acetylglucosamine transferase (SPINDLY family)